jgi:hypothetical protein
MAILNGIQNFLQFLSNNWTVILVCIGLIIGIVQKTKYWFSKSKEERYKIAKQQIREIILKKITVAEIDFAEWNKSGSIKRSQVIDEIYSQYPILSKIVDQSEVIAWLDEEIDNALKTLRDVIKNNEETNNE